MLPKEVAGTRIRSAKNRREQVGWYFYDLANSAYYTTVVTVFLGPYLTSITKAAADAGGFVYPFGVKVSAGSFFPYLVSLSVALHVIVLPVMGAIADYSGMKRRMFAISAYLGAFITIGMYFLQGTNYLLGGLLFLISHLSYGVSLVLYNAFLPEIAGPEDRDRVSSIGWGLGYLGGGVLLALNMILVSRSASLGITTEHAVRISLASAGVWWAVFTLIPLATLRRSQPVKRLPKGEQYLIVGFRQLRETIGKLRNHRQTALFLVAYLLYNDGIQTVIILSSQFGQEELKIPISTLAAVILMVQFVACFGSFIFNYLAGVFGAKRAIMFSLLIWIGALAYIYSFLQNVVQFFILGAVIALVLGGSQALSRSLYSQMIPKGQEAGYFSLYEISDKGSSWMGPLLFGLAFQFTGQYRVAILSLAVFFILGIALLGLVNIRKAKLEADADHTDAV
jgi:UMF1 family MFS transporter